MVSKTEAITLKLEFERQDCVRCHFTFCVPVGFTEERRESCKTFWCPQCGCGMSYSKGTSEKDRLRRERDQAVQEQARLAEESKVWQATATAESNRHKITEHRRRAAAGQVTKIKKRITAGVCPCCNRSGFTDLQKHMASKHPGFVAEPVAGHEDVRQ